MAVFIDKAEWGTHSYPKQMIDFLYELGQLVPTGMEDEFDALKSYFRSAGGSAQASTTAEYLAYNGLANSIGLDKVQQLATQYLKPYRTELGGGWSTSGLGGMEWNDDLWAKIAAGTAPEPVNPYASANTGADAVQKMLASAASSPNISQEQYNRLVEYTRINNAVPEDLGEFFGPTPMVREGLRLAGEPRLTRTYTEDGSDSLKGNPYLRGYVPGPGAGPMGVPFTMEPSGNPFYAYKPVTGFGRDIYDTFKQLEQSQLKAFDVDIKSF